MNDNILKPTARTRLRRLPQRGSHNRTLIHSIIDETYICTLAVAQRGGALAIPTTHGRIGEMLYVHGAVKSRMVQQMNGETVCLCFTILDGLVLSKSAFHHSMNFRSVILYGDAAVVEDAEEKLAALEAIVEHMVAGRWSDTRHPSPDELRATSVLRIPIVEASAKVRTGPAVEDPADMQLPHWSGEVPLRVQHGTPVPAEDAGVRVGVPDYLMAL